MSSESKRSEFVILHHDVGPELTRRCDSHFDWMFRIGDSLRTWATVPLADFEQGIEIACQSLNDHRPAYLDYEGDIGGNRGRVTRVLRGSFDLVEDDRERFVARLHWDDSTGRHEAEVRIYRSFSPDDDLRVDESRDELRLRFSPGR